MAVVAPSRAFAIVVAALFLSVSLSGCVIDQFGRVQNARTGPGDNAVDLLSSQKYKRIIVEIDVMGNAAVNPEALDRLKEAIRTYLDKPAGMQFDTSGRVGGRGDAAKYTFQELDKIEEDNRDHYGDSSTIALYILYADGGSTSDSGDSRVLGAAYHGTSIVMFKGNIKEAAKPQGGILPSPRAEERCIERAVLVHELGHVLGLVNHGLPMVKPHEDPDHKGHSANQESVMYYAVENAVDLFNIFSGGCSSIPHTFDANDKADMKAAGGK